MTATVAASKSYEHLGVTIRESLEDVIWDISPQDTWFMNSIERGTSKSTLHEWLTDSLSAPAQNAQIEGDPFSATARNVPTRLKTYMQISSKQFEVTGTQNAVDNAGMAEMMGYHTAKSGKELKRDVEKILLGAYISTAGGSTAVRTTGSTECYTYTNNHIKMSIQTTATTPAPSSGLAQAPTAGTTTTMNETEFQSALQQAWSCGGEVDTICVGPALYNRISTFTGLATRFRNVEAGAQAQIIGAADVYVSAFGSHKIRLSRYCQPATMQAFDMTSWKFVTLRPFQTVNIAKVGDADRRMILVEFGLVCKTPTANAKITGAA